MPDVDVGVGALTLGEGAGRMSASEAETQLCKGQGGHRTQVGWAVAGAVAVDELCKGPWVWV
jgi:hypothetical protein